MQRSSCLLGVLLWVPITWATVALTSPALAVEPILQWVASYDGPGNSVDAATDIAVDGSENVYVTGASRGDDTGLSDYATLKYDPAGNQLWVARYNGPGNDRDFPASLALDDSGNVYVTGRSYGDGTGSDYATVKYDPEGNELWVRRYDDSDSSQERGVEVAIGPLGNVHVTGSYVTIKYDPDGNELWVSQCRCAGAALEVDTAGYVYVTGESGGEGGDSDYTTFKYDPDGNEVWVARYDGPGEAYDNDYPRDLAVDDSGNVYVTGSSEGLDSAYAEYATVKYDPNGIQLWDARYDGGGPYGRDEAVEVAIHPGGGVVVTGWTFVRWLFLLDVYDFTTVRYGPDGQELWVVSFDWLIPGNALGDCLMEPALAIDASGNVFVAGGLLADDFPEVTNVGGGTVKYDEDGSVLWSVGYDEPAAVNALALGQSGDLYVTGSAGPSDFVTIRYSERESLDLIAPENGEALSSAPTFTWSTGVYDAFVFYSVFHYPSFGYLPMWQGVYEDHLSIPTYLWEEVGTEWPCFWTVLGVNSTTWEWDVADPRWFLKTEPLP